MSSSPKRYTEPGPPRSTRVFISYSRSDARETDEFAQRLRDLLSNRGYDAYLDLHDILPGEDWKHRLGQLIAQCDTFIFCISPRSVASEVCDWETNEAERLGKRVVPVVCLPTPTDSIPPRLNRLNLIFLRPADDAEAGIGQLTLALDTDIEWLRFNTWLGERANEWQAASRATSKLLRSADLSAAETWRDSPSGRNADVPALLLNYVRESRRWQTRSSHIRSGIAIGVALLAVTLSFWALWNRKKAITARDQTVQTAQAAAGSASAFVYNLFGGYDNEKVTIDRRVKLALLNDARRLLDKIEGVKLADSADALQARGAVETELSETLLNVGDIEAAIVAADAAVGSFKSLAASHDAKRLRRDLAVAYDRLGAAQAIKRNIDAAEKAYLDGIDVLSSDGPDLGDQSMRLTKAILLQRLGDLRARTEDWATSLNFYSESFAIKKEILGKAAPTPEYRRQLAESLRKLAEAKLRTEDAASAIVALSEVISLLEELYKEAPSASVARDLGEAQSLLAETLERANRLKEVDAALVAAVEASHLHFSQRPSCESYRQVIDATSSVALHLVIRRSAAPRALDMLRRVPNFEECRSSAIDARGFQLSLGIRQTLETLATELASATEGVQFWNAIPAIVAKLKPTIEATDEVSRWEDFSVRLAVFGAKSAHRAGAYGDAAKTVGRVLAEINEQKCATRRQCRRIALALGQLSWSALLAGDFTLAVKSSTEATGLVARNNLPNMSFVTLNHAHALLFSGAQSDATKLYDKFARKEVADDFRELRNAGRCHDIMAQFDPILSCGDHRAAN